MACANGHVRLIDSETVELLSDQPALNGAPYSLVSIPGGGLLVGGERGQLKRLEFESLDRRKRSSQE